jgi:hypothetical protein
MLVLFSNIVVFLPQLSKSDGEICHFNVKSSVAFSKTSFFEKATESGGRTFEKNGWEILHYRK